MSVKKKTPTTNALSFDTCPVYAVFFAQGQTLSTLTKKHENIPSTPVDILKKKEKTSQRTVCINMSMSIFPQTCHN